jgi:heme-degrading monooxygenase HmoA
MNNTVYVVHVKWSDKDYWDTDYITTTRKKAIRKVCKNYATNPNVDEFKVSKYYNATVEKWWNE